MLVNLKNYWNSLPDLSLSHILLRIPLALVFINAGISKLPFNADVGAAFGLNELMWWVVVYGEIAAGVGLFLAALGTMPRVRDITIVAELADLLTRFCGITMCCIVTGIIWVILKPVSLWQFVLQGDLHLFLWAGGLYFALRGNWAVAVRKKL